MAVKQVNTIEYEEPQLIQHSKIPTNGVAAPSPAKPNYNAWDNIGTSDAQATWQKMYDNEARKTQTQNAQRSAMASRNAAQQAALGGYNAQAGARLHDVLTAGANRGNQQANEGLQNMNLQTQSMIAQDKDQRTQSALQEIMRINPNAGAAAMRAYMTGGDINQALQPFYDSATGQIKAYTQAEQATDAKQATTEHYIKNGDRDWITKNIGTLTQDQQVEAVKNLGQLSKDEAKKMADALGTVSVNDADGLNQLYNNKGQMVFYENKLYIVSDKSSTSKYPDPRNSWYDYREYTIILVDPNTGKETSVYKGKRASNW